MGTRKLLNDDALSPQAIEVFEDIKATRKVDDVNNFWRALAHDPEQLKRVWEELKLVMGPGEIDPLAKEMIYLAVSVTNACQYCIHSHTAAARARGMTEMQHNELLAVIAMAAKTNHLATALQVPLDDMFVT